MSLTIGWYQFLWQETDSMTINNCYRWSWNIHFQKSNLLHHQLLKNTGKHIDNPCKSDRMLSSELVMNEGMKIIIRFYQKSWQRFHYHCERFGKLMFQAIAICQWEQINELSSPWWKTSAWNFSFPNPSRW